MLGIYAGEADAFDDAEVKVLQELADDLAYGVGNQRESEQRKRIERELELHANFDRLTGLANGATMQGRLSQAVADARRNDRKLALMFVNLDRFKMVNDTLGRAVGDRMLCEVAGLLGKAVRESDRVARLGSDEFVLLLTDLESTADAVTVAAKLSASLSAPMHIDGHELRPSASIGISLFPDDAT